MLKKVLVALAALTLSVTGLTAVATSASAESAQRAGVVYFASGSAKLTKAAKAELREIAAAYVEVGEFLITGYVQKSGNSKNDYKLSAARAKAVKQFLVKNGGSTQMFTVAAGVPSSNKSAASARRVTIDYTQLEPAFDTLPDLTIADIYGHGDWACATHIVVEDADGEEVTHKDYAEGDGCVGDVTEEDATAYSEVFANLAPGTYTIHLQYVANPYEVTCFDFSDHVSIRGWALDSCSGADWEEEGQNLVVNYSQTVELTADTTVAAPNLTRVIVGANEYYYYD